MEAPTPHQRNRVRRRHGRESHQRDSALPLVSLRLGLVPTSGQGKEPYARLQGRFRRLRLWQRPRRRDRRRAHWRRGRVPHVRAWRAPRPRACPPVSAHRRPERVRQGRAVDVLLRAADGRALASLRVPPGARRGVAGRAHPLARIGQIGTRQGNGRRRRGGAPAERARRPRAHRVDHERGRSRRSAVRLPVSAVSRHPVASTPGLILGHRPRRNARGQPGRHRFQSRQDPPPRVDHGGEVDRRQPQRHHRAAA